MMNDTGTYNFPYVKYRFRKAHSTHHSLFHTVTLTMIYLKVLYDMVSQNS